MRRTLEEKAYWKEIWKRAQNNVPWKRYTVSVLETVHIDKLPVPLYVALSARGNIKESKFGGYRRRVIIKRIITTKGKPLFLAMLGDFDRHAAMRLYKAGRDGHVPSNPKRRERLLKMAESPEFAWDYLRNLGIDHQYTNEYELSDYESVINPKTKRKW